MRRREYMKVAGAAGGIGIAGLAIAGINRETEPKEPQDENRTARRPSWQSETPEDTSPSFPETDTRTEQLASEYETVVDLVAAGAETVGGGPINDVLRDVVSDDTLLTIPPGTYRLAPAELLSFRNLGIVSTGPGPVIFRPTAETCRGQSHYLQFAAVRNLRLDGLVFDFRRHQSGGVISVIAEGDATVRNTATFGSCSSQVGTFRIDIRDGDGVGLVENLRVENTAENPTLTGIFVGQDHSGELTFRDCSVAGFSDNGLYGSAPGLDDGGGGKVHVVGGTYRNNNIAGVRLGSVGSTARDVQIVVDEVPTGGKSNARGIRLRGGSDHLVSGCRLWLGDDAGVSFGAVVFHTTTGGATVRDTTIRVDRDGMQALHAFPPEEPPDSPPRFHNVSVTGSAANKPAVTIQGRDRTVFRNCTIRQTGENRDGISLSGAADCRIENSRIEVTGTPVTLANASVTLTDTKVAGQGGEELVQRRTISDRPLESE